MISMFMTFDIRASKIRAEGAGFLIMGSLCADGRPDHVGAYNLLGGANTTYGPDMGHRTHWMGSDFLLIHWLCEFFV